MIDFNYEMRRFMHHSNRQRELENFLQEVKRLRGEHDVRTGLSASVQKLLELIEKQKESEEDFYDDKHFRETIAALQTDLKKAPKPSILVL